MSCAGQSEMALLRHILADAAISPSFHPGRRWKQLRRARCDEQPHSGTAADIIKLAMVNIARRLSEGGYDARLILQVHDELIIETNKACAEQVGQLLKSEMENAVSLSVPLTVEISSGDSWYDAK